MRIQKIALAILFIAGALVSFMTVQSFIAYALGMEAGGLCNISAKVNCAAASQSPYAAIFGLPLGSYGVTFYLIALAALLVTSVFQRFDYNGFLRGLLPFSFFSVLGSLFLLAVSVFELESLCPLCCVLYLLSFLQLFCNWKFIQPQQSLRGLAVTAFQTWGSFFVNLFSLIRRFDIKSLVEYLLVVLLVAQAAFLGFISPKMAASRMLSKVDDWPRNQKMQEGLNLNADIFSDYYSGDLNAPVQIVEYLDYECPFCRKFNQDLKDLLINYSGKYSLIYKNYPLDRACNQYMPQALHLNACNFAEFVRCAGEQGQFNNINNQFLEVDYLEALDLTKEKSQFKEIIEMSQLDRQALDECMQSDRQLGVIRQDVESGNKLGIKGTPSLWINGKEVRPMNMPRIEKILKILTEK